MFWLPNVLLWKWLNTVQLKWLKRFSTWFNSANLNFSLYEAYKQQFSNLVYWWCSLLDFTLNEYSLILHIASSQINAQLKQNCIVTGMQNFSACFYHIMHACIYKTKFGWKISSTLFVYNKKNYGDSLAKSLTSFHS